MNAPTLTHVPSATPVPSGVRSGIATTLLLTQRLFSGLLALTLIWGVLSFPAYKQMLAGYAPVLGGAAAAWFATRPRIASRLLVVLNLLRPAYFVGLLAVVAFGVRLACIVAFGQEPVNDHRYAHEAALRILNNEGYGPSAYYPPGMAFWLAGVYALFGPSVRAAQLVNCLIGAGLAALTYGVGRRVGSEAVGRAAGATIAFFPSLALYATTIGYDPLLALIFLTCVWLLLRRHPEHHHWTNTVAIGLLSGLGLYLKPIGLFLPGLYLATYLAYGLRLQQALLRAALIGALMLAVISPWTVRNYRLFHEIIPVTTSGGVGLWIANNPDATGLSLPIPPFPADVNEYQRDRILWQKGWDYIRNDPLRFVAIQLPKAAYLWGTSSTVMATVSADRLPPRVEQALKLIINTAWSTLVALLAWGVLRYRTTENVHLFWPVLAFVVYLWGVHLFYEAQSRYHLPVLPMLAVAAAYGWVRAVRRGVGGLDARNA